VSAGLCIRDAAAGFVRHLVKAREPVADFATSGARSEQSSTSFTSPRTDLTNEQKDRETVSIESFKTGQGVRTYESTDQA
jgi:hypothetical protein